MISIGLGVGLTKVSTTPVSGDVPANEITDENNNAITDENGNAITDEN